MAVQELFRDDAYLRSCEAVVTAIVDDMLELDRTVFYPTAGGQPGDSGKIRGGFGEATINETRKGAEPGRIFHKVADDSPLPSVGDTVSLELDWDRRHRLMRMHSCLHLLCRAVDGTVTGGSVGDGKGRLDFDLPESTLDKAELTETINQWIAGDHGIRAMWVDEAELDARPELVRTMSVQPPRGSGRIRLIEIDGVDLQACGGTHVRSTGEIGRVRVAKIEKKGRQNRRVSLVFDD